MNLFAEYLIWAISLSILFVGAMATMHLWRLFLKEFKKAKRDWEDYKRRYPDGF